MDIKQRSIIIRTKRREAVLKVIVVARTKKAEALHKSQPISIVESGEFVIEKKEPESILDLLKSSGSLSDQGCSPSLRDYL